jgi:hypothetical protein
MVIKKVLMLQKGTQTKVRLIEMSPHVGLFVQIMVIEGKIKGMMIK